MDAKQYYKVKARMELAVEYLEKALDEIDGQDMAPILFMRITDALVDAKHDASSAYTNFARYRDEIAPDVKEYLAELLTTE